MKALLSTCSLVLCLSLFSCKECRECFLVKESNGTTTKSSVGERCDQEIDALEKHDLVCLGECYYQCK